MGPIALQKQFDRFSRIFHRKAGWRDLATVEQEWVLGDFVRLLYSRCQERHASAQEEIFGPVVARSHSRMKMTTVLQANDHQYGLASLSGRKT